MKNPKFHLGEDQRVEFIRPQNPTKSIEFFDIDVSAGFPKPTEQYIERKKINLHETLVQNEDTTFLIRVSGVSMLRAGILDKSMLLIDRSIKATSGMIILAVLYGEFVVKYLSIRNGRVFLEAANDTYKTIEVKDNDNFMVWGVCTNVINDLLQQR